MNSSIHIQPQGEEGADGRRKQYRKQRSVQSWEFEAEGEIAPPDFLVLTHFITCP